MIGEELMEVGGGFDGQNGAFTGWGAQITGIENPHEAGT